MSILDYTKHEEILSKKSVGILMVYTVEFQQSD